MTLADQVTRAVLAGASVTFMPGASGLTMVVEVVSGDWTSVRAVHLVDALGSMADECALLLGQMLDELIEATRP